MKMNTMSYYCFCIYMQWNLNPTMKHESFPLHLLEGQINLIGIGFTALSPIRAGLHHSKTKLGMYQCDGLSFKIHHVTKSLVLCFAAHLGNESLPRHKKQCSLANDLGPFLSVSWNDFQLDHHVCGFMTFLCRK